MKLYILSLVVILSGVFVLPQSSQAYSVTDASAVDLGNGKALFTITYKFGFLNREMYMPIVTARGTDTNQEIVSYQLKSKDNQVVGTGTMAGLVLAEAEIKNNAYYLPKGKSAEFTLVTVLNMPANGTKEDLSVAVTDLPFTMIDGNIRTGAEVADTELPTYKSPSITLK